MDQADCGPDVALPGSESDFVESIEATKSHRKADPIWDQFNKRLKYICLCLLIKTNRLYAQYC